jgi:hypothetical protein
LGNTISRDSPWNGDLYHVAIYRDDLTAVQIAQNFGAGVLPASATPPGSPVDDNAPPEVSAGPDVTVVAGSTITMAGTATDDGLPTPPGALTTTWAQISGPAPATIVAPSSPATAITVTVPGVYNFELTADDGALSSSDVVVVTVLEATQSLPAPSITPAAGTYAGPVEVTMSTTVVGATIRYTTDGTEPTASSSQYDGPFVLDALASVRARVFSTGLDPSPVAVADYVISGETRTTEGLLAFYPFNETGGDRVLDQSGVPAPLDMVIVDPTRTSRVPSGLRFDAPTVAVSNAALDVNAAIKSTNQFSVEMWLEPSQIDQLSAMVMGLSDNQNSRHLALVQEGTVFDSYVRSTVTNLLGEPRTSAVDVVAAGRTHVVLTRQTNGVLTLYVNGAVAATGTSGGTLASWAPWPRVHIGGERDGTKPWLGTVYLLAIYDRALDVDTVQQHFRIGDV